MELAHAEIVSIIRLAIAAGVGMAVGIERELREQAAGLRTHMLVSVGSCLFTLVSIYGFDALTTGAATSPDPSRVAAQIVTGIGFLGAGAIIREGMSIRGLTTAASLWVVAAVGMAVGVGAYWAAGFAVILTIASLWALRPFRRRLRARHDASDD